MRLRAENPLDFYLAHQRDLGQTGVPANACPHGSPSDAAANIQCPSCSSVTHAAAKAGEACGWSAS